MAKLRVNHPCRTAGHSLVHLTCDQHRTADHRRHGEGGRVEGEQRVDEVLGQRDVLNVLDELGTLLPVAEHEGEEEVDDVED